MHFNYGRFNGGNSIGYGVDIAKVREVLKNLLSNRDDIMSSPAPAVFLNNISESAVEFKILFWEADISTTGELKSRILTEIYQAMAKEGIDLPSTQKDLYLHFPDGAPVFQSSNAGEDKQTSKRKPAKESPPDQDQ